MSQKALKYFLVMLSIGAFVFSFNSILKDGWSQMYTKYFPCQKPINYRIISFDSRFKISEKDFLQSLEEAEKIWESSIDRDLFSYKQDSTKNSDLKVNLVFDYRQEATTKIKSLGLIVSDTKHSYDALKAKYGILQDVYLSAKKEYEIKSSAVSIRQKAYMKQVDSWNSKGGAPQDVYEGLNKELSYLKEEFSVLEKMENNLNTQVGDINALVTVINRLAQTLNLNASKINTIGKTQGEEFTQGEYKSGPEGEEINIYEFSTKEKLVRLLAHELGHALGLGHIEDPEAIMYRLNENKNQKLTADDISALKEHCKIK